MSVYSFRDAPLRVYGAPFFCRDGSMKRLPAELACRMFRGVTEWGLDTRSPGARLAFRTDAAEIRFHMELERISPDIGMSLYAAQSADVFIGGRYRGQIVPRDMYREKDGDAVFETDGTETDVLVFLPRNEPVKELTVTIPDQARITAPRPYTYSVPVLFYGSSITEGAHAGKPSNAWPCLLSRWLDFDFINFGLSGSARGELFVADYLNTFEKSVFVMDYDYNAPDSEYLKKTHEPFFLRIREKDPDIPILVLSGPWLDRYGEEAVKRREIIQRTVENAEKRGDKMTRFIDGGAFFGNGDRDICSADRIHPNDLGMLYIAEQMMPYMKDALAAAKCK